MSATSAPAQPTDAELARRIAASAVGEAGWEEEELCRRFASRIRLYGLRHLFDKSSVDDLVQRVLEVTLTKLRRGQVREPERIASFVLGVARMQSRNMWRRGRREEPLAVEVPDETDPTGMPQPLALARLTTCLQTLSERERTVILLSFFDHQSSGQIARALESSPGNVRVIRHRAVDRLRQCMGLVEVAA